MAWRLRRLRWSFPWWRPRSRPDGVHGHGAVMAIVLLSMKHFSSGHERFSVFQNNQTRRPFLSFLPSSLPPRCHLPATGRQPLHLATESQVRYCDQLPATSSTFIVFPTEDAAKARWFNDCCRCGRALVVLGRPKHETCGNRSGAFRNR